MGWGDDGGVGGVVNFYCCASWCDRPFDLELHSSKRCMAKSAYNKLNSTENNVSSVKNQDFWLKAVLLKVNFFAWRLFLDRVPTKNNLVRRHIIALTNQICSAVYGFLEDRDHLFVKCKFFGRLSNFVSGWLWFSKAAHGSLMDLF